MKNTSLWWKNVSHNIFRILFLHVDPQLILSYI